jgi:hypothetical protein
VIVRAPVSLPADVGVKTAVKLVLVPAGRDSETGIPITLKPEPVTLTLVTAMPTVPVLARLNACFALEPTATFP